jgi:phosphoglycolate phosphatase
VLFDFDGTLADTAADLAAAMNRMRTDRKLPPLGVDAVRPFASMGARGMLRVGFGMKPEDNGYGAMRDEFLRRYEENVCHDTRLFPGIAELIESAKKRRFVWGIVTNKAQRFTDLIVRKLALTPDCVVCGDSTPHLKPHPAPLLLAAERLKLSVARCLYLGDDLRDIQAARAAGMRPVAVEWGYTSPDNGAPASWNADFVVRRPLDLLPHLS